jgi:hypothetical protein
MFGTRAEPHCSRSRRIWRATGCVSRSSLSDEPDRPRDVKVARLEVVALRYAVSPILGAVEPKPRKAETQRKLDLAWGQMIVTLPPEPRVED